MAQLLQDVLRIEEKVRIDYALDDAPEIVNAAMPHWQGPVEVSIVSGGHTNVLVRAKDTISGEVALMRVYGAGTDAIVDREVEIMNVLQLHEHGLGPPVYARFLNGFVYGFVEGTPLDADTARQDTVPALIAQQMAKVHALPLAVLGRAESTGEKPGLLERARNWLAALPERYENAEVDAMFRARVSLPVIETALEQISEAVEHVQGSVFSHNDLTPGNIVLLPMGQGVSFIDFEYGGPNFRAFDIGNHFCEMSGVDCDYTRYPGRAERLRFVERYTECVRAVSGVNLSPERLLHEAEIGALVSLLFWGVWALLQAHVSLIDFDFMTVAVRRLNRLIETKDAVLEAWRTFRTE